MMQELLPRLEPVEQTDDRSRVILVVDDDLSQLETLTLCLQRQGFRVLSADDGATALKMVRHERPHLIILDLWLPDIDGWQVCEQLADAPGTCDIPIIILSGLEHPDIVRSSRAAGCQFFMHKPYDPNALLALIQHSLGEADRLW